MPQLETVTKRVMVAALLAVTGLQVVLHPDITAGVRAAAVVAFGAGWLAARAGMHAVWLFLAPLAPALMLVVADRQGPIADLVWTAGLAGTLVRTAPASRWNLPPLWAALLGGWALVLSVSWPVFVAREAGVDLHALRDVTAFNSWAPMTAPQVVAWTLYVVQMQLLGILWFDWAAGAFAAAGDRLPRVVHGMWIGVTAASVVALVQGTIDIGFLNVEFWIAEMRATGTMLDANAYGIAAALAGPVGFLAIRRSTPWRIGASVLVLAVNWSGVWMSSSRTAFLCALLGAAGLTIGLLRARRHAHPRARTRPILLTTAAAAACLIILFAGAIGPLQRIAAMSPNAQGLVSLWERGGYGTIANAMLREYPFTGVGVGAYRYLAPDYWREIYDAQLQLDNAQNWWRHQAAELGILGGSLVLLWSLVVAWQVAAGRLRGGRIAESWTVRALLVGVAAVSLFGVPTQNLVVLLWFFFLVAWLLALVTDPSAMSAAQHRLATMVCLGAIVLAAAYTTAHALLASGPLEVSERAKRFGREYAEGAYPPELMADGREFRWTDDRSRFIVPARSEAMVFRLWAHHPDIAERPVTFTLAGPCGEVITRDLSHTAPIAVGVLVPPGVEAVDASISVSRTWTPVEHGGTDTRTLGVGVNTDFVDRQYATTRDYVIEWPDCPPS